MAPNLAAAPQARVKRDARGRGARDDTQAVALGCGGPSRGARRRAGRDRLPGDPASDRGTRVAPPRCHTRRDRPAGGRREFSLARRDRSQGLVDSCRAGGAVILAHGRDANRSFMLSRARFLVMHGYNAFPIDLRGHGESGGRYMTPGVLEALDILGAVDAARHRGDAGPFVALGHSSGAVASLQAAARSPEIAAVIADGAFISPDRALERATEIVGRDAAAPFAEKLALRTANWLLHSSWGRAYIDWAFYERTGMRIEPHDADALPAIARIGARPVLFIVGAQDAIAPPDDARQMYEAALSPAKALLVVPGAGHNTTYGTAPALYETQVLQFLVKALGAGSKSTRRD